MGDLLILGWRRLELLSLDVRLLELLLLVGYSLVLTILVLLLLQQLA